jgi:histidinol-phosphatase (PHP family)
MYFSDATKQLRTEDMPLYKSEILSLKEKYKGIIDVFCGLEVEYFSDIPTEGYDYLIGSVHYLYLNDYPRGFDRNLEITIDYINEYFGGDAMKFAEEYYKTIATLPQRGNFDIIGHFDLITKNNEKGSFLDVSSKKYLDMAREAIHELKGKIPLFELNTGCIPRGYRSTPYPQPELLKEFLDCGFGVVITSDCHNKNYIDSYFEEGSELLKSVGFKSKFILTDDGFKEVNI